MGTIPGRIEPVFLNGGSAVAENIVRLFAGRANTPPLLEGVIEIAASTSTNEFPRNRGCDHGDSITVQGNTQRFQGGRGRRGSLVRSREVAAERPRPVNKTEEGGGWLGLACGGNGSNGKAG